MSEKYEELRDRHDYERLVEGFADDILDILFREYEDWERDDQVNDVIFETIDGSEKFIYNRYAPLWGDIILFGDDEYAEWEHCRHSDTALNAMKCMAFFILMNDVTAMVDESLNESP